MTLPTWDLSDVEKQLTRAARTVAPFTIELSGAGSFRPTTQVVYAALTRGAASCDRLQRASRQGPLELELRFDYHPHVTVAQDVPAQDLDAAENALRDFRAEFEARSFVLYERGPDGVWNTIRTYPLTGRD
ncbi:2'-5' RNA ligase family protein [Serinibacter arcticus]|uniref:2'-5' RNA ligase family protein n=1 Tax=Serinibacter arcticus TaxID=1655435 RepID=UPI0013047F92|nr:2'-5' RNA ligase family protein [Serinibacter arcticus]